jgi:hypothetical protein
MAHPVEPSGVWETVARLVVRVVARLLPEAVQQEMGARVLAVQAVEGPSRHSDSENRGTYSNQEGSGEIPGLFLCGTPYPSAAGRRLAKVALIEPQHEISEADPAFLV